MISVGLVTGGNGAPGGARRKVDRQDAPGASRTRGGSTMAVPT
jgi:hypothetical protein